MRQYGAVGQKNFRARQGPNTLFVGWTRESFRCKCRCAAWMSRAGRLQTFEEGDQRGAIVFRERAKAGLRLRGFAAVPEDGFGEVAGAAVV
jgi:hypothetical protein